MDGRLSVLLFFSFMLFAVPVSVHADSAPPPYAYVDVFYNGNLVNDVIYAKPLTCSPTGIYPYYSNYNNSAYKKTCGSACSIFLGIKIQDTAKGCYWIATYDGFCGSYFGRNDSCFFTGYHFYNVFPANTLKLVAYLPSVNKTFITNEVKITYLHSTYRLNLMPDGSANLIETTPVLDRSFYRYSFVNAFIMTIILELIVALVFLSVTKTSKKVLISVLVANLISLPVVWFVFPLINMSSGLVILFSEVFAVVFEAFFIYLLNKNSISIRKSLVLSIIMNVISFLLGGLILSIFFFY